MFASVLIILGLLHQRGMSIGIQQAIEDTIRKIDYLAIACPPGSFFYDGSCYFYLPPEGLASFPGVRFHAISANEAAKHCRLLRADLWDIETLDEFAFVLDRVYLQTPSFDSPRIAVNFTHGRDLLNLRRNHRDEQYLSIGNANDYSLVYKPLVDFSTRNTCLVIDISKATRRISLEEKFRLERRSDHYICKMKMNSCYNNTRCGAHGRCQNLVRRYKCLCQFMYSGKHCERLNSRGIQSILAVALICLASLTLIFLRLFHYLCQLKDKSKISMQTKSSPCASEENFYSIPNLSSDQLLQSAPHTIIDLRRLSIKSSSSSARIFLRHDYLFYFYRFLLCSITILLATVCCFTIYEFKLQHIQSVNITNEGISSSNFCRFLRLNVHLYYKIPVNYISLILLFLLICVLIFFENFSKKKFSSRPSLPTIFNSHSHVHRFESAAVFGIIALEILHIFDEFVVHGTKHFQNGPLIDLFLQFGIVLMLGLRYFPILALFEQENNCEDRLANLVSYALATMYVYCEILFKLQADMKCAVDEKKNSMIKEIFQKFSRMGINVKEYLISNQTHENSSRWFNEQIEAQMSNSTYEDTGEIDNDLTRLNYSLELNKQSILYNTLRYAPYYYLIVFLAVRLTLMFFQAFRNSMKKTSHAVQSTPRWKYVKYNLLQSPRKDSMVAEEEYSLLFRCLNSSILFFKEHVYSIRPYFRYSKLTICIYTSAVTLVYYFTFWIQDYTYVLTKKLLLFINLILCVLADLSKDLCYNLNFNNINRDIRYICLITAFIVCLQLFCGLKHYQIQMCNAYRGIFQDIPTAKEISSISIVSKSIHYPGRFMGSLIYSYGFLFLFICIFYILSRYILCSLIVLEFFAKLFLPMIVFFLFHLLFVRYICKLFFVQTTGSLTLSNRHFYYTFSYFSFFFDCFLGFVMCVTRITKAFLYSLAFFARLDYSPYGRGLEMYDSSYASYVSFFHIEKNQRHPVLNVFIDLIRQRLIDIRKLKYQFSIGKLQHTYAEDRLSQIRRFRWALFYTLVRNEQLKPYRKHRLCSTKIIQSKTLEKIFEKIGLPQTLPRKH